jgi:hypothetical protein
VSQTELVTRLAVRELWMTFRLLLVLVAFVGASAVLVLVPAPPALTFTRLALGLGMATLVASGVAAWSMAVERGAGRAGWLVTRSVARTDLLVGWFYAIAVVVGIGLASAAALGWLALLSLPLRLDVPAFAATLAAVAASEAAAIALGLMLGTVLRSRPAAVVAVITCAAIGGAAWWSEGPLRAAPGGAFRLVSELTAGSALLPDALRAAGIGLASAAVLLVVAMLAIERAEL